jgi:hypothetical protein
MVFTSIFKGFFAMKFASVFDEFEPKFVTPMACIREVHSLWQKLYDVIRGRLPSIYKKLSPFEIRSC